MMELGVESPERHQALLKACFSENPGFWIRQRVTFRRTFPLDLRAITGWAYKASLGIEHIEKVARCSGQNIQVPRMILTPAQRFASSAPRYAANARGPPGGNADGPVTRGVDDAYPWMDTR